MSFEVSKYTIREFLSNDNLYILPAYQRPISWTTVLALRLLDDIALAYADDEGHPEELFLGMSVFLRQEQNLGTALPGEAPKPNLVNAIIDGQQRICVITILLAVLRDLSDNESDRNTLNNMIEMPGDNPVQKYRLTLFTGDADILENYVQTRGSTSLKCEEPDLLRSQENILDIRDLYVDRLTQMSAEHRNGLVKFISDRIVMVNTMTEDIDIGFKLFVSLNDTNKDLDIVDYGRAIFLNALPDDERERQTKKWREYEELLRNHFNNIFTHIQHIHGQRKARVISANRAIAKLAGGNAPYLNNIVFPLCDALAYVLIPERRNLPETHPIHRYLTILGWSSNHVWMPPALQFISTHKGRNDEIERFLSELHRLVIGLSILGLGKPKRLTRYRNLSQDIANNTHWNQSSNLFLSKSEQEKTLYQLTHNSYSSSSQTCKLILLLLNDLYAGGDLSIHPSQITVEHVFPLRPNKRTKWLEIFHDANQRDICRASLGNQIPLSYEMNIRLKNWDYEDKKELMFPKNPDTGIRKPTKFAMSNRLLNIEKWDYETIIKNEEEYLQLLKTSLRLEGPCGNEIRQNMPKIKKQS